MALRFKAGMFSESVAVDISLKFNLPGFTTNRITAYTTGLTSKSILEFPHCIEVEVNGNPVPSLKAERDSNGNVRLRIGGQVGTIYLVEKSVVTNAKGQFEWFSLEEFKLETQEYIYTHIVNPDTSSMMFRIRQK